MVFAANEVKNDCNSLTAKVASDELRQSCLVSNHEVEEPPGPLRVVYLRSAHGLPRSCNWVARARKELSIGDHQ